MTALLTALLLSTYDPLVVGDAPPTSIDLVAGDVPVRVFLPAQAGTSPVILFSHGLGGSREGNRFLGEHWARRAFFDSTLKGDAAARAWLEGKGVRAVLEERDRWSWK